MLGGLTLKITTQVFKATSTAGGIVGLMPVLHTEQDQKFLGCVMLMFILEDDTIYTLFFFPCLQARIAFLQGERKGQENLKNDLVRRIKMLEYALKQER